MSQKSKKKGHGGCPGRGGKNGCLLYGKGEGVLGPTSSRSERPAMTQGREENQQKERGGEVVLSSKARELVCIFKPARRE